MRATLSNARKVVQFRTLRTAVAWASRPCESASRYTPHTRARHPCHYLNSKAHILKKFRDSPSPFANWAVVPTTGDMTKKRKTIVSWASALSSHCAVCKAGPVVRLLFCTRRTDTSSNSLPMPRGSNRDSRCPIELFFELRKNLRRSSKRPLQSRA